MKRKEDLRVRKTKINLYNGLLKLMEEKQFEDIKSVYDSLNVEFELWLGESDAAKYTDGTNIKLAVTQTDTKVRFTVQDVGPGLKIDGDELIFKPFVREGDLSEGLGLGLPLAKRHAKSLGGDLIFDSEYHEGCRVTIELPK